MKTFIQELTARLRKIFNSKKIFNEQDYNFGISIYTSHFASYQIKYIKNGYPVIEESLVSTWKIMLSVPLNDSLRFQVYVSNPTGNINLKCEIQVNEFSDSDTIISTQNFSYVVGATLDTWRWESFEVKSVLALQSPIIKHADDILS